MATIIERMTKDGKPRYTVQIRLKGTKPITKTFATKTAAKSYIQAMESDIRRGAHIPAQEAQRRTLSEAIDRYIVAVLPTKKESTAYGQRIQLSYWKERIGHLTLSSISAAIIADERDLLLQGETSRKVSGKLDRKRKSKGKEATEDEVSKTRTPATVVRYLAALSHCLSYTQKELGWLSDNPMRNVSKPREPRGRVRILSDEERTRLLAACRESKNPHLHDIVILLLSTAARRNEIVHLKWKHVDFARRVIVLDETKNGERRVIPIRGEAERILTTRTKIRRLDTPFVFPAPFRRGQEPRPINIQSAWDWSLERAQIDDFRMHDLRHSAASHLAMNGATLAELAEVLGHKTLQMVKRYSHFTEGHTGDLIERMNDSLFSNPSTVTSSKHQENLDR